MRLALHAGEIPHRPTSPLARTPAGHSRRQPAVPTATVTTVRARARPRNDDLFSRVYTPAHIQASPRPRAPGHEDVKRLGSRPVRRTCHVRSPYLAASLVPFFLCHAATYALRGQARSTTWSGVHGADALSLFGSRKLRLTSSGRSALQLSATTGRAALHRRRTATSQSGSQSYPWQLAYMWRCSTKLLRFRQGSRRAPGTTSKERTLFRTWLRIRNSLDTLRHLTPRTERTPATTATCAASADHVEPLLTRLSPHTQRRQSRLGPSHLFVNSRDSARAILRPRALGGVSFPEGGRMVASLG